jgi:hypothetical protein
VNFKQVRVSSELSIPVPDNLTPEEEATYIANRIAYVDLEHVAADIRNAINSWEEGDSIPMEDVLEELSKEESAGTNS